MKERKIYLDYLRVISCLAVIVTHIFTDAIVTFPCSKYHTIVGTIIRNLMHFAVPVFFMITGYLFLSNEKKYNLVEYIKKYVLKYVYAIFTFAYAYSFMELTVNKGFLINNIGSAFINMLEGDTWTHMWYLYTLVGVMLFIPILKAIKEYNSEYLKYLLILLFISSFALPLIEKIFNIKFGFDLIMVSPYLVYTILGYYIGNMTKRYDKTAILVLIFSIILINFFEIVNFSFIHENFLSNYNSIFILTYACSLFYLFKRINRESIIIMCISKVSYGIYLIHMLFIYMMYRLVKFNPYESTNLIALNFVFVFVLVFSSSFVCTKIMKKIPILKKIL